jgi:hypothetical protein
MAPIKTIAVTVTKTNLNDGGFHITTAANFDTLEKTNKVIRLTVIRNVDIFKLKGFAIVGGEDANKFTLNGSELTFKAPEFQDGSDNTYRVNIKATWSHWARGLFFKRIKISRRGNMKPPIIKVSLGYGYSDGFDRRLLEYEFGLSNYGTHIYQRAGYDINMISIITLVSKSRGFES